jgi:hypothetical protein
LGKCWLEPAAIGEGQVFQRAAATLGPGDRGLVVVPVEQGEFLLAVGRSSVASRSIAIRRTVSPIQFDRVVVNEDEGSEIHVELTGQFPGSARLEASRHRFYITCEWLEGACLSSLATNSG